MMVSVQVNIFLLPIFASLECRRLDGCLGLARPVRYRRDDSSGIERSNDSVVSERGTLAVGLKLKRFKTFNCEPYRLRM
jgi:hypothetical protein